MGLRNQVDLGLTLLVRHPGLGALALAGTINGGDDGGEILRGGFERFQRDHLAAIFREDDLHVLEHAELVEFGLVHATSPG